MGVCMGLLGLSLRRREPDWELSPLVAGRAVGPRLRVATGAPRRPPSRAELVAPAASAPTPSAPPKVEPLPARLRRLETAVRPLLMPALRALADLPSVVGLRRLSVEGRVGLTDPAATGWVCAWLCAVAPVLPGRVRVRVTPAFGTPGVWGLAEVQVHLYLSRLLWLLGRLGLGVGWGYAGARLAARRRRAGRQAPEGER